MTKVFSQITYHLERRSEESDFFQIAARKEDWTIGISIVEQRGNQCFILHKLLVQPTLRHQGIGTQLMKRTISHLRSIGAKQLKMYYGKDIDATQFSQFISQFGNGMPQQYATFYRVDFEIASRCFLMYFSHCNTLRYFNIFYYSELTSQQIEYIRIFAAKNVPDFSNPIYQPQSMIQDLSVFLFNTQKEVIAWTIVEELCKDELSFTMSYVHPDYRHLALGPQTYILIHQKMQQRHKSQYQYATFDVHTEDKRTARLNEHLFGESIIAKFPCYEHIITLYT